MGQKVKELRHSRTREERTGVTFPRHFTAKLEPGVTPYDQVSWELRTATIGNDKGSVIFEQRDVEVPADWSQTATNIVASKYFHGRMGSPDREASVGQLVHRVVDTIADWGLEGNYFKTREDGENFRNELAHLMLTQKCCFNSPVWFNVGVRESRGYGFFFDEDEQVTRKLIPGENHPQCSACFINSVGDSLESILDLAKTEGMLFKWGSGTGTNLSSIREEDAHLWGGGRASGPLSFMKGFDAFAGVIKSGGKTRRAAKMVILNSDHPDIEKFVWCKAKEEKKAHTLIDAGYDSSLDGDAYSSIFFQNANNSVRATDEFMHSVADDTDWWTRTVVNGQPVKRLKGRELMRQIAEATHQCGDPGMQFDTTINRWHTSKNTARINASNPCCFVGETLVDTSEGRIRFDALEMMSKRGMVLPCAYSWDLAHNLPALKRIKRVWKSGSTSHLVEVKTDKGITLRCTPDHRFLGFDGEYIRAADLKPGSRLRKIGRSVNTQRSGRIQILHRETEESPSGCTYESAFVWEAISGPIPEGTEVHHKNENPSDDRGSNLELMAELQHKSKHARGSANNRFIEVADSKLAEVWDAIEATPRITHKSAAAVTPARWNAYVRANGLQGIVPSAGSPTTGGWIQGMTWEQFAAKIESLRCLANDRVESVTSVELSRPVPVFDLEVDGVHSFAVTNESDTTRHTIVVHNSEYMFLDDSACNLASLNLMKFVGPDGAFDVEAFRHAVDTTILAQEIIVDNASYPTDKIAKNSHDFRPLGLGYANLGAMLMSLGLPYDGDNGRDFAAAITAIMCSQAYLTSARIAEAVGPCVGYAENEQPFLDVIRMHWNSVNRIDSKNVPAHMFKAAEDCWRSAYEVGAKAGYRNAQVTVLAPTGTIGFMMDCDTTGIEPDLALVKYKKLVGGGVIKIVNNTVPQALIKLGYTPEQTERIVAHIDSTGTIEGAPNLKPEHLPVFDCSFRPQNGIRSIHYMGHVRMMAAVQPFISGAISKTINMPEECTVEDVMEAYTESWRLGLKAVAIYRDNSKRVQPLSSGTGKGEKKATALAPQPQTVEKVVYRPVRRKLPDERQSVTHKFSIGGHEGYITVGLYEDGTPGEVFISMAKEGSTISGLMDTLATSISYGLQYGVPLKFFVDKFSHVRFEPSGWTGNTQVPYAKSIIDYIFRWLGARFLGITEASEAATAVKLRPTEAEPQQALPFESNVVSDAPMCSECGSMMTRNGSCYKCENCGGTSGCS